MQEPVRPFYMLVRRPDGSAFHAATVQARRAKDAHAAFPTPDYGQATIALSTLSATHFNPSAAQIVSERN